MPNIAMCTKGVMVGVSGAAWEFYDALSIDTSVGRDRAEIKFYPLQDWRTGLQKTLAAVSLVA